MGEKGAIALRCEVGPGDLLILHRRYPDRYPYFLESAASGTDQGRFDILFALPEESFWLDDRGRLQGTLAPGVGHDFLDALDRAWYAQGIGFRTHRQLPFSGGWFLLLGYELAQQVEPTLTLQRGGSLPVALATRVPAAVVRDRSDDSLWVVAERPDLLSPISEDLRRAAEAAEAPGAAMPAHSVDEDLSAQYLDAVARAKEYIRAGDVFQANLARCWRGAWEQDLPPADLYDRLRRTNPGPFAGLAVWRDAAIVSSSPERLLRLRDGKLETRPIAGTRPRGRDLAADRALARELFRHPKERAEHVMLIDLERNDLGRICKAGTVEVDELMVIESYAHVHHIVSNVCGVPVDGLTPGQAIRAVFPGGTITGCPKVRCMEIISELESGPRGPYTGSMGYLNRDGTLDLNILIRTVVQQGRQFSIHAGAGIVADSDPQRELEETRAKARGMLLALGAEGA